MTPRRCFGFTPTLRLGRFERHHCHLAVAAWPPFKPVVAVGLANLAVMKATPCRIRCAQSTLARPACRRMLH